MSNSKKTQRWLDRKAAIRQSATLDGRQLADEFCAEGRKLGYECDHIVPLDLGGRHHRGNMQWLSPEHNKQKKNKPWTEWAHPGGFTCTPYPLDPEDYVRWCRITS